MVLDVVESVRLMLEDEPGQIHRWRRFVDEVVQQVLPATGGRLVKSLGDGMLLEFASVRQAASAALAMQQRVRKFSTGALPQGLPMELRVGIHEGDVVVDELDLYGNGVNLAARIATLAGPGEIVVTAEVRDGLWADVDADIEDLGDCFLKHFSEPVRAYRLGPAGARPVMPPASDNPGLQPSVAVIPFDGEQRIIGDLLADGVIAQLSLSADLRVLSRLSCSAFAARGASVQQVGSALGAHYVVSGSALRSAESLFLSAELSEARSGTVLWAERLHGTIESLLQPASELIHQVAAQVHQAVLKREVERARSEPLPALESCSMLFGAVNLMHRQSRADFDRARQLLEHLCDRHARSAQPRVWLAMWYALGAAQGWRGAPGTDTAAARQQVERALLADSVNALAWSIKGLLEGYVNNDFDAAATSLTQALHNNPNESLAWLYLSTLMAWRGQAAQAQDAADRALLLSPLDPLKYYYDSLAGAAMLGARNYPRAVELSQRSIRSNRAHLSTFRVLAAAQLLAGDGQGARSTVVELMNRDAGFSVATFLRVSPWRFSPDAQLLAAALKEAGVPEN